MDMLYLCSIVFSDFIKTSVLCNMGQVHQILPTYFCVAVSQPGI
jgi:hypothetical protein